MATLGRRLHLTSARTGVLVVVLFAIVATLLFLKIPLMVKLRPGDTITVDLARDYKVRPDITKVKIAGVPVGVVTSVESGSDGTGATMKLKVDKGIVTTLGSAPSAQIRPTTILGGNYYVQLTPGGDRGSAPDGPIPASRTTVPVELDATINMFTAPARTAIHDDVGTLDSTFTGPATPALRHLVADAPRSLRSSAQLLRAVEGQHPATDLTSIVTGLESISRQLDGQQAAFSDDIRGFRVLSQTLRRQSGAIRQTVVRAPATLRHTSAGLDSLSGLLDQTRQTSQTAGPSVQELTRLLAQAPSDVDAIRPVVADLRPLMSDLDPTVQHLVPTSKRLQTVVDDVRSPVIDRITGPVLSTVDSPVRGKGTPMGYQQVAYMFTTLNLNSMTTDSNGAMINFQPGIGPDTGSEFIPQDRLMKLWQDLLSGTSGSDR